MKRFHWPMQRLLDVTVQREKASEAELGRLAGQIRLLEGQAAGIRRRRRECLAQQALLDLPQRLESDPAVLNWAGRLDRQAAGVDEKVQALRDQRQRQMEHYMQLRRSRRTLENLRDQARQRYRHEADRHEQSLTDEAAGLGFARRLVEGARASESHA